MFLLTKKKWKNVFNFCREKVAQSFVVVKIEKKIRWKSRAEKRERRENGNTIPFCKLGVIRIGEGGGGGVLDKEGEGRLHIKKICPLSGDKAVNRFEKGNINQTFKLRHIA
jgi:hypothetical protein